MELDLAVRLYLERLESLLSRDFGGTGKNLDERVDRADLPDYLRASLREIVSRAAGQEPARELADTLELVFLCGQAHERLETLAATRLVEPFNHVQMDGTPGPEMEMVDIANVAQFVDAWQQFMRKVADFVLKLMLVSVVVLFIGLMIGLI